MEKNSESIKPNLEKQKLPTVFKIYNVKNFDELENIIRIGDSEKVETGDYFLLRENNNITTYSYGAGPCISGVLQTTDNKIYMFHSFANILLTPEQEQIVKNTKRVIIGSGNNELLDIFSSEFKGKNIKVIRPPGKNYDFNIVFVKYKNEFNTLPGLYFCHSIIENPKQQLSKINL